MGSKRTQGAANNGQGGTPSGAAAAAALASMAKWEELELKAFYKAFHKLGTNWPKVARTVGTGRAAEDCEMLYRQHQTFLSLPSQPQLEQAFVAMVTDVYNNLKEGDSDTVSDTEVAARERNDSTGASTPHAASKGRRTPRSARRGNGTTGPEAAGRLPPPGPPAAAGTASNTPSKPGPVPLSKVIPPSPATPASAMRSVKQQASLQQSAAPADTPGSVNKRKRSRRLFSEDDAEQQGDTLHRQGSGGPGVGGNGGGGGPGGDGQAAGRPYRWQRQSGAHDDVGEGVDALLSLASGAHAASSSMTEGLGGNGEDEVTAAGGASHGGLLMPSPAKGMGMLSPLGRVRGHPSPPPAYGSPLKTMSALEPPRSAILHARHGTPSSTLRPSGGSRAAEHALHELAGEQPSTPTMPMSGTQSLGTYSPLNLQPLMAMPPPLDLDSQLNCGPPPTLLDAVHPETPTYPPRMYSTHPPMPSRMASLPAMKPHYPQSGATAGRAHKRKPGPEKLPPMMSPMKLMFQRAGLLGSQVQQGPYGQPPPGSHPGQSAGRLGRIGETGDPMGAPELALRHALGPRTRRWCMYEFHTSAIDLPWFLRSELHEFLAHLGLAHATHLTRTEWSIIRSAFGRPRRLSLSFLKEERAKLEAYRESVRKKYEEQVGVGMEVPVELPRALRVGQEVTARHPVTRQLHDGVILTVKGAKYRVQFNRSELMTEVVKDVDIMALDPSDNLPASMAGMPLVLNGRINAGPGGHSRKRPPPAPARGPAAGRAQQEARAAAQAAVEEQSREADGVMLMEVSNVLDMKENLLGRLREMNDQAEAGMHLDAQGRQSEDFQRGYAQVVLQLKDVNQQAEHAMARLSSRMQMLHMGGMAGLIPVPASPPPSLLSAIPSPLPSILDSGPPPTMSMPPLMPPSASMQQPTAAPQLPALKQEDGVEPMGGLAAALGGYSDEPSSIVSSAMAEARACVMKTWEDSKRARETAEARAAAATGGGGGGSVRSLQEEAWLTDCITGCVGMLFTVQRCITSNVGPLTVEAALDTALTSLRPHSASNATVHRAIAEHVAGLRAQLTRSL